MTSGVTADSAYAERNITYDQAGNIQTLSRVYGGNLTDSLVYNYTKNAALTNQVQNIQDLSADVGTTGYAAGTGYYHYDPNGNMNLFSSTNPAAKTYSIVYNLLNLPYVVNSSTSPLYEYDANGEKLNRFDDNGETDYIGGIQYDNGRISFIQTEEGRVFPYSTDTSNYYQYFLADHLGNIRIAFDTPHDTLKVEQRDDYLPFGMEISQGTAANPKNQYLYNKKELQEDSQLYDYGARFYDPVVGRWNTVDPLAEFERRFSTYIYVLSNPIRFLDPDGKSEEDDLLNDKSFEKNSDKRVKIERDISNTKTSTCFNYVNGEKTNEEEIKGVHFVRESQTPTIFNSTLDALGQGKPSVLHYDPADRGERSKQALRGYPSRGGDGLQRDEYPYASTREGGEGAVVNYVPQGENRAQGGYLSGLYSTLNVGDAFLVLPVPRGRDSQPEFNPVIFPQNSRPKVSPIAAGTSLGALIISIIEAAALAF